MRRILPALVMLMAIQTAAASAQEPSPPTRSPAKRSPHLSHEEALTREKFVAAEHPVEARKAGVYSAADPPL